MFHLKSAHFGLIACRLFSSSSKAVSIANMPIQRATKFPRLPFVDREQEIYETIEALAKNKLEDALDDKRVLVCYSQMFGSGKTTLAQNITRLDNITKEKVLARLESGLVGTAEEIMSSSRVLVDLQASTAPQPYHYSLEKYLCNIVHDAFVEQHHIKEFDYGMLRLSKVIDQCRSQLTEGKSQSVLLHFDELDCLESHDYDQFFKDIDEEKDSKELIRDHNVTKGTLKRYCALWSKLYPLLTKPGIHIIVTGRAIGFSLINMGLLGTGHSPGKVVHVILGAFGPNEVLDLLELTKVNKDGKDMALLQSLGFQERQQANGFAEKVVWLTGGGPRVVRSVLEKAFRLNIDYSKEDLQTAFNLSGDLTRAAIDAEGAGNMFLENALDLYMKIAGPELFTAEFKLSDRIENIPMTRITKELPIFLERVKDKPDAFRFVRAMYHYHRNNLIHLAYRIQQSTDEASKQFEQLVATALVQFAGEGGTLKRLLPDLFNREQDLPLRFSSEREGKLKAVTINGSSDWTTVNKRLLSADKYVYFMPKVFGAIVKHYCKENELVRMAPMSASPDIITKIPNGDKWILLGIQCKHFREERHVNVRSMNEEAEKFSRLLSAMSEEEANQYSHRILLFVVSCKLPDSKTGVYVKQGKFEKEVETKTRKKKGQKEETNTAPKLTSAEQMEQYAKKGKFDIVVMEESVVQAVVTTGILSIVRGEKVEPVPEKN